MVHVDFLMQHMGFSDTTYGTTLASNDDCQRLVRYMYFAGCKLYSYQLAYFKQCEPRFQLSDRFSPFMKQVDDMLAYSKSLEPRPDSLQFQCRRVIREQMSIAADGKSILDGIDDLPLPVILHDYLKLKNAE